VRKNRLVLLGVPIAVVALVIGVVTAGGAGAKDEPAGRRWGAVFDATSSGASRSAEPASAAVGRAGARTLVFIQEATGNEAFVDVPPGGESVGDSFIFRDRLEDPRTRAHVGSLSVQCTLVFFTINCEGTAIIFDRGKITLSGNVPDTPRFAVAITGGTREFRAARGQVFVDDTGATTSRIEVQLV
jgi:hypothetical protein